MRRRLALLVSATMALTLFAFVVPLAILIRIVVADIAMASATDDVRALSAFVAANPSVSSVRGAMPASGRPVTVFLPGRQPIGVPARRTAAVQLAEQGQSFTVLDPGGREILVAVQGVPGGTAVIRTFVSDAELTKGVTEAWLILAGLGLILVVIGVGVANLLVGTVTRPISELARVSHRLAAGGLEARANPAGPPEVRQLAQSLNHLGGRIRELIWAERESIADLSHRLRTPLTALRLEVEALPESADPEGRLSQQVLALGDAVTSLIDDARMRGSAASGSELGGSGGRPGSSDAAKVTGDRVAFWLVLAEDQGRRMAVDLPESPVPVGVAGQELAAGLDALLGNVFAHTPQGTALGVSLRPRSGGGGMLTVSDSGPGFAGADLIGRGSSGSGSTGLGLDIARQAAEASGGSLTIESGAAGARVVLELGPAPS
ncbi:MAG TPA: HAMP domain-containing sensor histidine kinase [Streptosporangiaceae bacterium]|nr:HAMP domain-containing sensor histidine kinase [Streptosporangiaceae bacterium]